MGGNQAVAPLNDSGGMGSGKQAGIRNAGLNTVFLKGQREVARGAVVALTKCGGEDEYAFFFRHLEFARTDFKTQCGIASMDFSAFLGLRMQKNNDRPKLRTVDESPEEVILLLEGQPAVETAKPRGNEEIVRLEAKDRGDLKFRTHEPKFEEWVEQESVTFEDEWNSGKAEKSPPRRSRYFWIYTGLILALAVGWLFWDINQITDSELAKRVEKGISHEPGDQSGGEAMRTISTIEEVVRQFYRSTSVDEMLKHVRHAERVRPLMEDYYSKNPMKASSEVALTVDMNPLTIEKRAGFWVVLITLDSGLDGKLVVEVNTPRDAKVDWETYVCWQPMEWDRFVKDRPEGYRGDFRVFVERDQFYNYEFADSEKYQAYRITALNSQEVMFGYAPRNGEIYQVIDQLLTRNNNQKVPMLLRLHLKEGLKSKSGVVIDGIVAKQWLLVESPEVKK